MIQYVLASHGNFAREALNSARMICGVESDRIHLLSIQDGGEGIARFEEQAGLLAKELSADPVLIMADLFGGGPFMTLLSAFRDNDYKCIAGFNLSMVIELLQAEEEDLGELAEYILETGRDSGIRLINKIVVEEEQ